MKQYYFLRKITLAVAFSIYSLVGLAQAPAIQWDKTFGGDLEDYLTFISPTSDNGYILGGYSYSGISGNKTQPSQGFADYWVVKLDALGNLQWNKTFGGNFTDQLHSIKQTSDGGYILGGLSISGISGDKTQPSKGGNDFWIIKLDAAGNVLWDKTLGGNQYDNLFSLHQTPDNGYILAGVSNSGISGDKSQASRGNWDYWVIKLDAGGSMQWDKTFGGNDSDWLRTLTLTSDGGYILGGWSQSGISGDKSQVNRGFASDFWIVKLDSSGNKIWDKTIGGNSQEDLTCLIQITDGGYILGGHSNSHMSGEKSQNCKGGWDNWIVKLDNSGNKLWDKTFGGNQSDALTTLIQTPDGGFILGGSSQSGISIDKTQPLQGTSDFWVLKADSTGNILWDKTIGGNHEDDLIGSVKTSDGGYALGGRSNSGIAGNKSQVSNGGFDYWIVKLGSDLFTTSINEPNLNFNLSISPNPSQGKFQLQLNNLTAKTAAITISDLVGRAVYQQEISVTENQMQQEINLPAVKGMYMLQVKAGEQTTTRKIVIE